MTGAKGKLLRSAALPIAGQEFAASLSQLCTVSARQTIGLAVSGGVDSMALAYLSSRLQDEQKDTNVRLQAFVVDHGARLDSRVEAYKVSHILRNKGIPSEVLSLKWPRGEEPPRSPQNFETLARRYRYQTLGRACRKYLIKSLLLAHHDDDQAETLLMRLLDHHRRWGLQGMRPSASIPECHGIYGVHQSGSPRLLTWGGMEYSVEEGGVTIYRPLLSFNKDRLIATCQEVDMPWFEDPTNQDVTLTKRNTVRHFMSTNALPAELTKANLLAMGSRMRHRNQNLEKKADTWLRKCTISSYWPQSGVLVVNFARPPHILKNEEHEVAARLLRRLITQVTPLYQVKLDSLQACVENIFPWFNESEQHGYLPKAFNVAGVLFSPSLRDSSTQSGHTLFASKAWIISRQTPKAGQEPELPIKVDSEHANLHDFTPWQLFDNRFWIRFHLSPTEDLNQLRSALCQTRLRFLRREDIVHLRNVMERQMFANIRRCLKDSAPGNIRYTVPVLETRGQGIIGMPTLGLRLHGLGEHEEKLKWEVSNAKGELEWSVADSEWQFRRANGRER